MCFVLVLMLRYRSHRPIAKTTRLALGTQELTTEIEDQVVALVDAPWHYHRVTAAGELGEDRRLGPKTDVDRMIGQLWLRKSELRVVHASKLFVKS